MGRCNKFDYQTAIENSLIAHPDGLALDELLERSGLEVDRSTLFRHLTRLIAGGRAERIGQARASRYRPIGPGRVAPSPEPPVERLPAVQPVPVYPEREPADKTPVAPPSAAPPLDQPARAEPDRVPAAAVAYGETVNKAVRKIVSEWKRFSRVNLQIYLSLMVKPEHVNKVAAAVEKELAGLHQGNLAAYGLSPAEFAGYTPPAGSETIGE